MSNQVKDAIVQDSGFCSLCNRLCFNIFDELVRQRKLKENASPPPLFQTALGRVKTKLYEELV